ncbi:MAG: flavodoxin-dependent (E)-4-hydroxy-3-methylbut-2-enyl-diphosphate synthase [Eubacteriales bacterium]|nr:flavodoxin-dependent (E)-4-hydroxy-3-methylbut-2-enyl-diphosphate synthase [Eubacteriales bacterium]MDY3332988.1 flavodoxin-dependent (E)-4-hydroxy-3-methylbut-2-enyl-diphosphate synthase [Gallibacter sp.]
MDRRVTRKVNIGDIIIGGNNPIAIQSMSNIDTRNIEAVCNQIDQLKEMGCDIMRLAVPTMEAAEAFGVIKKKSSLPLVADIHFDYRLAIESIRQGADKIRINPGNIGDLENVKKIVNEAKAHCIPIRIGVNSGSLQKDILEKYRGTVNADGLVESAMRNVELVSNMGFDDIVISLKASDPKMNFDSYMKISNLVDYPLHIGVTEAGTVERGKIKSAVGIGGLLLCGVGDTLRVSLTGDPANEIITAKSILASAGLTKESLNLVSCPTCARTKTSLEKIIADVEEKIAPIIKAREENGKKSITVAIMGCEVNGPGEAKSADLGVACGDGVGVIFSKGKIISKVNEEDICDRLIEMVKDYE